MRPLLSKVGKSDTPLVAMSAWCTPTNNIPSVTLLVLVALVERDSAAVVAWVSTLSTMVAVSGTPLAVPVASVVTVRIGSLAASAPGGRAITRIPTALSAAITATTTRG